MMAIDRALRFFNCRRCGMQIAVTDGERLYLGSVYATQPMQVHCQSCGETRNWRPVTPAPSCDTPA